MTPEDVKNAAITGYGIMVAEAHRFEKKCPSVMAALYVPTQDGGVLAVASSIKGPQGSQLTEFYCSSQHKHGNCAEMNAFALVERRQMDCRNSFVAAYGSTRHGVRFLDPCRDEDNRWGCASFCTQNSITALTKRSRIEGLLTIDVGQEKRESDDIGASVRV
ncbi:uncharacterized protein BP5553_05132 [Venustampulla echinocandica]|uniref:CMP/dCMP-type deaminase domain-containing protein n=1 Tax=Venustampulla echinocandica TaxID=2656787 RepID=A0A370TQA2_9HELO|nr:uncharacterized protein BP5553_05132 [Venustampulla echinocandica]RDL37699.1 hypothetical protein BP5553_05132 [Venustampulla echinocandica]